MFISCEILVVGSSFRRDELPADGRAISGFDIVNLEEVVLD